MAFAPANTSFFPHGDGSIRGSFRNSETDTFFEFSAVADEDRYCDAVPAEFNMKVWVTQPWDGDCGWRFAKVVKTRAYVVVDENDDGTPVVEKWVTKQTRFFDAPEVA